MRVIYVGKFKKSSTCTEASVAAAFQALGHDVTCVNYLTEDVSAYVGLDWDLALFSKCEPVRMEILGAFKCKTAMWIFDSLHDTSMDTLREGAGALVEKAKMMDRLFTAAPGDVQIYRNLGCRNAYYLPQACDDTIFFDRDCDRDLDITFIGNNYGNYRSKVIRQIYEYYGDRFKLFSKTDTWDVPVERALTQDGVAEIFSRSKITLNMSETPEDDKWSRRVWDAMGCGAVVAAQHCPSFDYFFGEDEIVTWQNVPQLFEKIDELLDDTERLKRISERAADLVSRNHTYKHGVLDLLKMVGLGD